MTIYFICIFIIMLLGLNVYSNYDENVQCINIERCCTWATIILVVVAALRGSSVGADTASYIKDYSTVNTLTYADILSLYSDNPGYYLLSKIFSDLKIPIQIWFAVIEGLYLFSVKKLIKRFSYDVGFSYILFIAIGLYAFSLAGLKQTLAISFVFLAYYSLYENKYVKYMIFTVLAIFSHLSAIVSLFALIIYVVRKKTFFYPLMGMLSVIWVSGYGLFANILIKLFNFDHYGAYFGLASERSGTLTMFYIQLVMIAVSLLFYRSYKNDSEEDSKIILGMTVLCVLSQLLAIVVASAFRIGLYYSLFSIILLSNCIGVISDTKARRVIKILVLLVFIFYFWYGNHNGSSIVPYKFFWQY